MIVLLQVPWEEKGYYFDTPAVLLKDVVAAPPKAPWRLLFLPTLTSVPHQHLGLSPRALSDGKRMFDPCVKLNRPASL